MRAPRRKRRFSLSTLPRPREHPVQVAICKVLTIELAEPARLSPHGVIWFSVDHANFAGMVPGVRIARGIVAGLPDLWFLYRGKCFLIELKTPNGELSDAQQIFLAAARLAMVPVGVCINAEQVLFLLDQWSVPRSRRTLFPLPQGDAA